MLQFGFESKKDRLTSFVQCGTALFGKKWWLCAVTVNIKRLSDQAPSSGICIVWREDSWRWRIAAPQLSALQTMHMPLDGANTADS